MDDDSASYEYYTVRNDEDESSFVGINDILNIPAMAEDNSQIFYLTFGNNQEAVSKDDPALKFQIAESALEEPDVINEDVNLFGGDSSSNDLVGFENQDVKLITLEDGQMFVTTGSSLESLLNDPASPQQLNINGLEEETAPLLSEVESEQNFQILELPDGTKAVVKIVKIIKNELANTEEEKEEPPKKKKFQCLHEGCDKFYATSYHLTVHMRTHTDCKPYECYMEGCEKKFSTNYSLKAHIRTHTGEKPYPCSQCAKKFKTSGDLQKHVRIHTGEKPFICPVNGCGKSFTTSNIRKVHIRSHTGERPYSCTYPDCGKAFTSSTNYKNHMRIHSGEKPYVCMECDKRFTEYSSLYKHHSVHQPVRPCLCLFCGQRFKQESALIFHKRLKHNVVVTKDGTEIIVKIE